MTFILKYASIVYEREERYEAHSWFIVGRGDYSTFGRIQTPKEESLEEAAESLAHGFLGDFPPDVCGIYVVVHATGGKYLQVSCDRGGREGRDTRGIRDKSVTD